MNQDEIIEMACQAFGGLIKKDQRDNFVAFAKLIAEKEREACAMLCLWHNNTLSQNPTLFHMAELIRARSGEKND